MEDMLVAIAEAVLEQSRGSGFWRLHDSGGEYTKPENAMAGLSVGDIVYWYDCDACLVMSCPVVFVKDGVGFYVPGFNSFLPKIKPITDDEFARTPEAAAALSREAIKEDLEYYKNRMREIQSAADLLS